MAETIAAAAILHKGKVWHLPPPARHHTIIQFISETDPNPTPVRGGLAQGFVTSTGRYVTRKLAGEIALIAEQTKALRWGPYLYSEDLW